MYDCPFMFDTLEIGECENQKMVTGQISDFRDLCLRESWRQWHRALGPLLKLLSLQLGYPIYWFTYSVRTL